MEQFAKEYQNLAAERDYLQDVAVPYYSEGLHKSLDEVIALKKEKNELREKLARQQTDDTTYTTVIEDLIARTKASSKMKMIQERIKKKQEKYRRACI